MHAFFARRLLQQEGHHERSLHGAFRSVLSDARRRWVPRALSDLLAAGFLGGGGSRKDEAGAAARSGSGLSLSGGAGAGAVAVDSQKWRLDVVHRSREHAEAGKGGREGEIYMAYL